MTEATEEEAEAEAMTDTKSTEREVHQIQAEIDKWIISFLTIFDKYWFNINYNDLFGWIKIALIGKILSSRKIRVIDFNATYRLRESY